MIRRTLCVKWKLYGRSAKENNTRDSNVVPHRSTNRARTCLTSQSGRDVVLSCWYGRSRSLIVKDNIYTAKGLKVVQFPFINSCILPMLIKSNFYDHMGIKASSITMWIYGYGNIVLLAWSSQRDRRLMPSRDNEVRPLASGLQRNLKAWRTHVITRFSSASR